MLAPALFSAKTVEWATPETVVETASKEFRVNFTLDVCANAENAKCERYFDPEADGLKQSWAGETCWLNPPYGRQIGLWIAKAWSESHYHGATVACLLPARTDVAWFHDYCLPYADEILFVRGRIKFGGSKNSAPFPSMLLIFRPPLLTSGESELVIN